MNGYSDTASIVIRRERDADLINRISNDPAVLPFVSLTGREMDWSPVVRSCVILSNGEDACMILEQTDDRDWQMHTIFAPSCRGKRAVETGLAMKAWMRPYADVIFGSIPDSLPHAKWFSRKLGGEPVSCIESRGDVYVAKEGETLFALRSIH